MDEQSQSRDSLDNDSRGANRWYARKRIVLPVLFFIIMAAAVFVYWYMFLKGYISTDDAYIDGDSMTISAKMLGRIVELNADEGDTVQQGQLLVALDDSDLQADLVRAKANIDYSKKSATLAGIDLKLARDDFKRAQAQFDDHIISVQEFDHARKAAELARAKQEMSEAAVNTAKAELNVIETRLANTRILAPSTGVVARRWVIAGDVISPGEPVFTIFDLEDIWVTANFEETKISSIKVGDPVRISVDSYSGRSFEGQVLLIGAATASRFSLIPPNNAAGNFTKVTQRVPVKISVANGQTGKERDPVSLIPGMSVVVRIDVKEK
jgi:membrane fusion protein (multidrug efflux system)